MLPVRYDDYREPYDSTSLYPPQRAMTVADYHPFIALVPLLRVIFADAGYEVVSRFLQSEQAEDLIAEDEYALDAADAPDTLSEESLPQGATLATQPSAIAFDEGQRRYGPTEVMPTEDPSMNQPLTSANERAYADDAKAFGR